MNTQSNMIILYVESAIRSTKFYADLLKKEPVMSSDSFSMFALDSGLSLGFWNRKDVQPKVDDAGVSTEIVFSVKDAAEVETLHKDWAKRGLPIAQKPVKMDWGHTFVALDPDGHRLRVSTSG